MDYTGDEAEDGLERMRGGKRSNKGAYKEDVDEKVSVATSFEEDAKRGKDDGKDDFADAE